MPIDFTLSPDVQEVRQKVRKFMDSEVRPAEQKLQESGADRNTYVRTIMELRGEAKKIRASGTRTCRRSGTAWTWGRWRWLSSPRRPGARASGRS